MTNSRINPPSSLINFNGQIKSPELIDMGQMERAFRYGDGLFETIRLFNGRPHLMRKHWSRLKKGMQLLRIDLPPKWSGSFFSRQIHRLTGKQGQWRIRLTVFRANGGLYTPTHNQPLFLIEAQALTAPQFQLNKKGLRIGICKSSYLSCQPLSNIKSLNSLPYILAAQERLQMGWDDGLLLNEHGRIAEASSSNLFILKNQELLTPPIHEGCLDGCMRSLIIKIARQKGMSLREQAIPPEVLDEADAVVLSNSISGIKWVKQYNNRIFGPSLANTLMDYINETIV